MKLKPFSPSSIKGVTLIEILVSTSIVVVVSAIVLTSIISFKSLYSKDVVNVRANQDLRGIFDVLSGEIRLLGGNLPWNFPALLVTNGASGAPDILTIRRSLLEETLTLCQDLVATSNDRNLFFSYPSDEGAPVPATCGYNVNASNFDAWTDYLAESGGLSANAYVFSSSASNGEHFTFRFVEDFSSGGVNQYRLFKTDASPNWQYSYATANASVYALEEWQIELDTTNNFLRIIDTNDQSNFLNIANNVTDFQVRIEMQDGSFRSSFTSTDSWQEISAIEITLEVTEGEGSQALTRSWTSKFLPRNIISAERDFYN
jgi:type II secretory pathway pseudopilin PulG